MMQRIKIFILSFFIALNPAFLMTNANASTLVGGWTVGDALVQGATSTWNATKDIGGKVYSGVASLKPTPAQVAKGISRFGVGLAITAATQALLDGVDYVLDPKNNAITYKKKGYYAAPTGGSSNHCSTPQEACKDSFLLTNQNLTLLSVESNKCNYVFNSSGRKDSYYALYYEPVPKSTPINTVAQQLITDADNGDKEAQQKR